MGSRIATKLDSQICSSISISTNGAWGPAKSWGGHPNLAYCDIGLCLSVSAYPQSRRNATLDADPAMRRKDVPALISWALFNLDISKHDVIVIQSSIMDPFGTCTPLWTRSCGRSADARMRTQSSAILHAGSVAQPVCGTKKTKPRITYQEGAYQLQSIQCAPVGHACRPPWLGCWIVSGTCGCCCVSISTLKCGNLHLHCVSMHFCGHSRLELLVSFALERKQVTGTDVGGMRKAQVSPLPSWGSFHPASNVCVEHMTYMFNHVIDQVSTSSFVYLLHP